MEMAADNLSWDLSVHSFLSFKLVIFNLQQQNYCYQSPHLVFRLAQFNFMSLIADLYDWDPADAPVFLYRNDTSNYPSISWFYISQQYTKIKVTTGHQNTPSDN